MSAVSPRDRDGVDVVPGFVVAGDPTGVEHACLVDALAAVTSRALDDDAVAVFLRLGFFLADDTPFLNVRATARPPELVPAAHRMPRAAVADAFGDAFCDAIRRRLPREPYVLPLSGGRDSRHILLELWSAGHPPVACVTVEHFPPRGNDDVGVASAVCARLGITHHVLRAPQDRLGTEEDKNVRTSYCTDEHAQFVALRQYLVSTTSETYDGIGGDVLSQSGYLHPRLLRLLRDGQLDAAADILLDPSGTGRLEEALGWILAPAARRRFTRARAHARLVRELLAHARAPNPIASFYFWNRTRREIALAPFALLAPVRVHAPFLDRRVFDGLMATPAELLMDRRLHDEVLARRWPDMLAVPYAALRNDARDPRHQRTAAAALIARLVRRRSALLNPGPLLARCSATLLHGRADHLWFLPLVVWLAQVERLASRAES